MAPSKPCQVCQTVTPKHCQHCKKTAYCSAECQRSDWKVHKKRCKKQVQGKEPSVMGHGPAEMSRLENQFKGLFNRFTQSHAGRGALAMYDIPDYAWEYEKEYPTEKERISELKANQQMDLFAFGTVAMGGLAFDGQDFTAARFQHRWSNFSDLEVERIMKKSKVGDIIEKDFSCGGHSRTSQVVAFSKSCIQQTMRNTPLESYNFEPGRTYVGFGFTDLGQLMWGAYPEKGARVTFHGYDQSEVAVARSLLIWEMMKAPEEEVSNKTILQVWFSSCWDQETKQQFATFLRQVIKTSDNGVLKKHARVWTSQVMSVKEAEQAFGRNRRGVECMDLINLASGQDCVLYSRYLFTGCIFMDAKGVSGNVTMFPSSSQNRKHSSDSKNKGFPHFTNKRSPDFENFFNTLNLSAMTALLEPEDKSLIQFVQKVTKNQLAMFRKSVVQEGKLQCHLKVKEIRTGDETLAKEIRSMNPHRIDWSNIPEYFHRHEFQRFAEKCSGPSTIHTFHVMNWVQRVFGAQYLDYVNTREELEDLCKKYRVSKRAMAGRLHEGTKIKELARMVRLYPTFELPPNQHLEISALKFGEKYLNHLLTTKEGRKLNRKLTFTANEVNPIFAHCPSTFYSAFSFDDEAVLPTMGYIPLVPTTI